MRGKLPGPRRLDDRFSAMKAVDFFNACYANSTGSREQSGPDARVIGKSPRGPASARCYPHKHGAEFE